MSDKIYELRPYQQECVDVLNNIDSGSHLVAMATGMGKCFAPGTPILMYDGNIKNVEDIVEGELVMGWDSSPRRVTGVTRGRDEMYRVVRRKHDDYVVNSSHILSLKITNLGAEHENGRVKRKKSVLDSLGNRYYGGEICNIEVKDYVKSSNYFKHTAKGFCVPVDFPYKEVPVDPYFLGVWIGDGRSTALHITTPDEEIVDYLKKFAYVNGLGLKKLPFRNSGKADDYAITNCTKGNPIRKYIRENLYNNKHIPKEYLYNSEEVRLQLLAGLLDTDGYLHSQDGTTFEFCTQYKNFQDEVAFLARSLGFTARSFTRFNKDYNRDYYYLCIWGDTFRIPTRVERKKARHTHKNKNNLVHGIEVIPIGVGDYYGFELEGPDRMFFLGDCTVVHNTVVMSFIKPHGRTLILSHREELVNQPVKYFHVPVGFEQANRRSNGEPVVCASVQSLVRRLDKFDPNVFDMIITDEAHHAVAPSYRKIYEYFKPRVHFGFTATPNRGDKIGLGAVYSDIVFERDLRWGIENNYLTDIKCLRVDIGFDISKVKKQKDDFNLSQLAAAVDITEQNEAVARVYEEYHKGQTLIFATTVKHAQNIAKLIPGAIVVSAETENRDQIIKDFTDRKIPCIVNCMVFTEGTDMPLIETIIIARPTRNSSLYTQMVGRGLRQYPGKDYLTLIDCVGISGKVDICTAPSLFGLDVDDAKFQKITKNKDGILLTDIEPAVNRNYAWKINAQEINIFETDTGIDTYGINYTKMTSGDFVLFMSGYIFRDKEGKLVPFDVDHLERKVFVAIKITIKAIDLAGLTSVIFEQYINNQTSKRTSGAIPAQKAFRLVSNTLRNNAIYKGFSSLWDTDRCMWMNDKATDRQIQLIKQSMDERLIEGVDYKTLTKGEARNIINILENSKSRYGFDEDKEILKKSSAETSKTSDKKGEMPVLSNASDVKKAEETQKEKEITKFKAFVQQTFYRGRMPYFVFRFIDACLDKGMSQEEIFKMLELAEKNRSLYSVDKLYTLAGLEPPPES